MTTDTMDTTAATGGDHPYQQILAARGTVGAVLQELDQLSGGLSITGNDALSRRLVRLANMLEGVHSVLQDSTIQWLNNECSASATNLAGVMSLATKMLSAPPRQETP
jgi:hypothetical protein